MGCAAPLGLRSPLLLRVHLPILRLASDNLTSVELPRVLTAAISEIRALHGDHTHAAVREAAFGGCHATPRATTVSLAAVLWHVQASLLSAPPPSAFLPRRRWERAQALGLNPPEEIRNLLLADADTKKHAECVWYGRV